jgi:hypothetical protein
MALVRRPHGRSLKLRNRSCLAGGWSLVVGTTFRIALA